MQGKLKITACEVSADGEVSETDKSFTVGINPTDISRGNSVSYRGLSEDEAQIAGGTEASPTFGCLNAETLKFSVTIDGTGVVPGTGDVKVVDRIEALRKIVYSYNGKLHEPNVCRLWWGGELDEFHGRLTNMDVSYTLFHPSGEALRAKVTLIFSNYVIQKEVALLANKSSPDLTHNVVVKSEETLPMLCKQTNKDPT